MENEINSTVSVKHIQRLDNLAGGEETEISTQIVVPPDGGWGWIVVLAGFFNMFVVDGIVYTFGSILPHIAEDFKVSISSTSIIGAVALAMYLMTGPIVSALINRYGFRAVGMTGSILSSFSVFSSYFITSFPMFVFLYGFLGGVGYCFIQLSSNLVVGFYFEKKRAMAMGLLMSGASIGMMTLSPINYFVAGRSGWRNVTILQSGLLGIVYFLTMVFRPILALTVIPAVTEDPLNTHALVNLPSLVKMHTVSFDSKVYKTNELLASKSERIFGAVKNENFPTAMTVVEDSHHPHTIAEGEQSSSGEADNPHIIQSRLTLIAQSETGITSHQMQQLNKIMSMNMIQEKHKKGDIDIQIVPDTRPEKTGCCNRCFKWEPHIRQNRPLYRDDAFYDGSVASLIEYKKSMARLPMEERTGFEYQMLVSRAATVADMQEKRGVFTTACRRVLATMLEPALFKKKSFILLSTCGFLSYMGFPVPFIFAQDKAIVEGNDPELCKYLVSALSVSVLIGRIVIGFVCLFVDPTIIYVFNISMSGVSIIIATFSDSIELQFISCCLFGFFGSSVQALRSIVLVKMFGLAKLTNSIGMMLLFCGVGSLSGPPIASILRNALGYKTAYYFAGGAMAVGGLIQFFSRRINMVENIGTDLEVKPTHIQLSHKKNSKSSEFIKDPTEQHVQSEVQIKVIENSSISSQTKIV